MGSVDIALFTNWADGQTIIAAEYKRERELLRVAINDNFARIIKSYKVLDAAGATKATQNLTDTLNTILFKEGSGIALALDVATSTLTIGITGITGANLADLSVTTAKLADLSVTTIKLANLSVTDAKIAAGVDAAKIGTGIVSNIEFGYLDGVTQNIQTQINGIVLGSIPDGSLTIAKLAFDPATQVELDAVAASTRQYADKQYRDIANFITMGGMF